MKRADLIENGTIVLQMDYDVQVSNNKNYGIQGAIFLPFGWNSDKQVTGREFFVEFNANWECDVAMNFFGEEYGTDDFSTTDLQSITYYQSGSVHSLINMSRGLLMIHHILQLELSKTDTYMFEDDNNYAKQFDLFGNCEILIKEIVPLEY